MFCSREKLIGLKEIQQNEKSIQTPKNCKVNIFCRPEEAMLETGKSLSHNKNIFCSKRNLDLVQPKIKKTEVKHYTQYRKFNASDVQNMYSFET